MTQNPRDGGSRSSVARYTSIRLAQFAAFPQWQDEPHRRRDCEADRILTIPNLLSLYRLRSGSGGGVDGARRTARRLLHSRRHQLESATSSMARSPTARSGVEDRRKARHDCRRMHGARRYSGAATSLKNTTSSPRVRGSVLFLVSYAAAAIDLVGQVRHPAGLPSVSLEGGRALRRCFLRLAVPVPTSHARSSSS